MVDSTFNTTAIIPNSTLNQDQFIDKDIPTAMIQYLKATNVLHTMFLKTVVNDEHAFCSASLPHLFYEDKINDKMGYANEPVIFTKPLDAINNETQWNTIIFKDEEVAKAKGFDHTEFFVINDLIYFPVQAGWPISGTEDLPKEESENPFADSFYNFSPAFNVFNKDGKFISNFGELPSWHKQHKTAYVFFRPIIKEAKDNSLIFVDSFIGKMYIQSLNSNEKKLLTTIFEVQDIVLDSVNFKEPSLEYFHQISPKLKKRIIDIALNDEIVYALLRDGDYYYVSSTYIGTDDTKIIAVFPDNFNDYQVKPYNIRINKSDELQVYSIMRDSSEVYLGVSKIL